MKTGIRADTPLRSKNLPALSASNVGRASVDVVLGKNVVETAAPGDYDGITLQELHVSRISYQEPGFKRPAADVKTPNGQGRYGWGVRFVARSERATMRHIVVRRCVIERVDHTGLKFTAPAGATSSFHSPSPAATSSRSRNAS